MKEYTLDRRQITSVVLVVLALLVVVFFLGVTVGERHERARRREAEKIQVISHQRGIKVERKEKPKVQAKAPSKSRVSSTKVSKTRASTLPKKGLSKGYYIQVGAFKEKLWAQKWQSLAQSKGYETLVLYSKDRKLYRVVIGPYLSKGKAVEEARKVDRLFKVRSSVVPDSRLR